MGRKIAILTPTFNYHSGIDRVAEQQAEEYSMKGYDVTVIALEANIKPKNYKLEVLGMPKNPTLQRIYRLLLFLDFRKMKTYKILSDYDVVISHFYPMNWLTYMAKKKYGVKYVYYNHGINNEGIPFFHKIYMKLFSIFNSITIKNTDEIFSVSKYLHDDLKKQLGMESKIAYNKIDAKKFNPRINGRNIRKKYNATNKKILLFVGRIAPHKNIHRLIEAFKIVKGRISDSVLIIAGNSSFDTYFSSLKKSAPKEVIFTGPISDKDLAKYYAACDLYVTASLWEGFDLPAAEAQACGKKVVAFDIGSHPEIVKKGILVKKNDIKGFAESILKSIKK